MSRFRSIMFLLLVSLFTLNMTEATPKERLKVKYKVKSGGKGERMKVAEEVMKNDSDSSLEYLNTIEYMQALPKTYPALSKIIRIFIRTCKDRTSQTSTVCIKIRQRQMCTSTH